MKRPIRAVLCVILSLPAAAPAALAHDSWINRGRYEAPDAAGPMAQSLCCGERDCFSAERDTDFIADGENWLFLDGPAARSIRRVWNVEIRGTHWPRATSQTYRSEDTRHWICVGPLGVRCFFYDYGGY